VFPAEIQNLVAVKVQLLKILQINVSVGLLLYIEQINRQLIKLIIGIANVIVEKK